MNRTILLLIFIVSVLCYPQKAYRKSTERTEQRPAVPKDTSEVPADFSLDLRSFDTYQRQAYFKQLGIERDKIPTYFNLGVNVIQNYPREIQYFRVSGGPAPKRIIIDTLTGKGVSSIGFGGHMEFALNEISFVQLGYNHTTMNYQLDSLGYSLGTVKSELHDIIFAFAIYAGPVRINIGDVFSVSKNGFHLNMYGGLGINLWKGLSLSANYQVFGLGMMPPEKGTGYIKGLKETDRYLYTSSVPGTELAYQHLSAFQLTLSVDLFFFAKEKNSQQERAATYRAWRSVAQLKQETDDIPLPVPVAAPPVKAANYSKYTDQELETMLGTAVQKEQYDVAEQIQKEIDRRSAERSGGDLTTMTEAQLQTKLKEAIQKEDYDTAAQIQKELKRRGTEKKEQP